MFRPETGNDAKRKVIILRDAVDHVLAPAVQYVDLPLSDTVDGHGVTFVGFAPLGSVDQFDGVGVRRPDTIPDIIGDDSDLASFEGLPYGQSVCFDVWPSGGAAQNQGFSERIGSRVQTQVSLF